MYFSKESKKKFKETKFIEKKHLVFEMFEIINTIQVGKKLAADADN